MDHGTYGKMSVEDAKRFLMTPPPSAPPRGPGTNALLLAAGAAAAGYLLSNPGRVRRLGRHSTKLLRSPMAKRALTMFLSSLAAQKAAR
jgi:hypothetical protein